MSDLASFPTHIEIEPYVVEVGRHAVECGLVVWDVQGSRIAFGKPDGERVLYDGAWRPHRALQVAYVDRLICGDDPAAREVVFAKIKRYL